MYFLFIVQRKFRVHNRYISKEKMGNLSLMLSSQTAMIKWMNLLPLIPLERALPRGFHLACYSRPRE